jgi:hypothetical protein
MRINDSGLEVLRRYYNAVWLDGTIATLDELLADHYVDHDPLPGFGADKAAARNAFGSGA